MATFLYNSSLAARLVSFADAAYCGDDAHGGTGSLTSWTCPPCSLAAGFALVGVIASSKHATFAFGGIDAGLGGSPVLAFRGAVLQPNIDDYEDNKLVPWWPNGTTVHRGLLRSYYSLRQQALALARRLVASAPGRPLYITGHSLGASQAALAALDLSANLSGARVRLLTFGEMRIGDAALAERYAAQPNLRTWRVTHRADHAPQYPARDLPTPSHSFRHHGTEVWYPDGLAANNGVAGAAGTALHFRVCDGDGEDPACEASVPTGLLNWLDHDFYINHSMWCCSAACESADGCPASCTFPFPKPPASPSLHGTPQSGGNNVLLGVEVGMGAGVPLVIGGAASAAAVAYWWRYHRPRSSHRLDAPPRRGKPSRLVMMPDGRIVEELELEPAGTEPAHAASSASVESGRV
ncbi:hypothetical protein EMIHUDRAFT_102626 [Emiliania huxleyi CCMP1516]|uniref:Fungal lipase-type domain-containing protein n=2 Tax=Emiliania huxleyi TaxID=2903 RepID=A0A0D3J1K0_EMIH1|nr:hypothetical protein EMIHUDRAFT_102626 [Emiliania huxleyi CCMP1516]EOD17385.1 hypothetical protein EMIHUDRAFT_102626 [Emiliania huxleyi CCMP1516]|eukprot:XP_005769814.1 hypothetical protein EMIHUDRAFT_102626 [Emiliania huxleyi CCMP1516]